MQQCYFQQPDSVQFLNSKFKLQSIKTKHSSNGAYVKIIHLKLNNKLKVKILTMKKGYFDPINQSNTYKIIVTNSALLSKTKYVIDEFGNIISCNSSQTKTEPHPYVDKIVNVIVY